MLNKALSMWLLSAKKSYLIFPLPHPLTCILAPKPARRAEINKNQKCNYYLNRMWAWWRFLARVCQFSAPLSNGIVHLKKKKKNKNREREQKLHPAPFTSWRHTSQNLNFHWDLAFCCWSFLNEKVKRMDDKQSSAVTVFVVFFLFCLCIITQSRF